MIATTAGDIVGPARTVLRDLPADMIEHIVLCLTDPVDLAAANAASTLFRGVPSGHAPVERALRERARSRAHARALPASLPAHVRTWAEELFARERVLQLARAHALVAATGGEGVYSAWSAFVDAEGALRTCGEERVHGGGVSRQPLPPALGHDRVGGAPASVLVPTRVASLAAVRVCAVAAGTDHLLALSDGGAVYACGDNYWGQLGLGDTEARRGFVAVLFARDELAVSIGAGAWHSLALDAAGCAYSWGHNHYGQLGHGDRNERRVPTRIEALGGVRVGAVSAKAVHTLLLSTGGAVHSCGYNSFGQLGHGDRQDQPAPRRIEALTGVRAVHVSAGSDHSMVVDDAGDVYTFGLGCLGRLGHGDEANQLAPKRVEALAGARAVRASAGVESSAAVGADGSVHAFGRNAHGVLGLELAEGCMLPTRVGALANEHVLSCSLSGSHALYVLAGGDARSCGLQSGALGCGPPTGMPPGDGGADDDDAAQRRAAIAAPRRVEQLTSVSAWPYIR